MAESHISTLFTLTVISSAAQWICMTAEYPAQIIDLCSRITTWASKILPVLIGLEASHKTKPGETSSSSIPWKRNFVERFELFTLKCSYFEFDLDIFTWTDGRHFFIIRPKLIDWHLCLQKSNSVSVSSLAKHFSMILLCLASPAGSVLSSPYPTPPFPLPPCPCPCIYRRLAWWMDRQFCDWVMANRRWKE